MKIYSAYDRPVHEGVYNDEPSLTQQHFADECDINLIMERVQAGQAIPQEMVRPVFYGDFTGVSDFRDALEKIRNAQAEFMSMDAKIRDRFNNDPANLLEFIQNPQNFEEGQALGLFEIPSNKEVVTVAPLDVTVTTDTKN